MRLLIPAALVLLLVFGPGVWVRSVMARYSKPADRYNGTGAELARYLLDKNGLNKVTVEETPGGDHYDPVAHAVRLSAQNFSTGSLTAIAVAAHEVGHAIQHAKSFRPLRWRTQLVRVIQPGQRLAAALLVASPFIALFTRTPGIGMLTLLAGFLPKGGQGLSWDGRDEQGSPLASGVYFARLETDWADETIQLVVLK